MTVSDEGSVSSGQTNALDVDDLDELEQLDAAIDVHEPVISTTPTFQRVRSLAERLEHRQQKSRFSPLVLSFLVLAAMVALLRFQVVATFATPLTVGAAAGLVVLLTMTGFLLGLGRRYAPPSNR